jgi:hypothetical protein
MDDQNPFAGTDIATPSKLQESHRLVIGDNENPFADTDISTSVAKHEAPVATTSPKKPEFLKTNRPEPKETSFGDVVSAWPQTVGPSAKAFGESLIEPFTHPKETAQAIGQLGTGIYSKARGALGYDQKEADKAKDEAALDQMGEYLKGRYGSKEAVMRTMKEDPVAFFADLSLPLTGGGSLAARAPGVIGTAGKAVTAVGKAIDPISLATQVPKIAAEATGKVLSLPATMTSGASFKSLKEAREAGATANPVFWEHYTGKAPPAAAVEAVEGAIDQIRKDASAEYMRGMKSLDSQRALPYDLVDNALNEARQMAYAKSGKPMSPQMERTYNTLEKIVADQKAAGNITHNIENFDELKRMLRSHGFDAAGYDSQSRKLATMVANSAKQTIVSDEKLPGSKLPKYGAQPDYAKIMEGYGGALDDLGEMKYAFTNAKTTDKKLSNIVKGQAGGKKGELLERLSKINPDIPYMIAGAELSPWFPGGLRGTLAGLGITGMAAAVNPAALGHAAFISPRVVGGTMYGLGRAGALPERTYRATQPAVEAARQAGRAEEVLPPPAQARGGRISRATGGRAGGVTTADMLIAAAERAKKSDGKVTESLLAQPDEAITRALAIANKHI